MTIAAGSRWEAAILMAITLAVVCAYCFALPIFFVGFVVNSVRYAIEKEEDGWTAAMLALTVGICIGTIIAYACGFFG
jgi:ABC-type enterochelin transport system permease subunit